MTTDREKHAYELSENFSSKGEEFDSIRQKTLEKHRNIAEHTAEACVFYDNNSDIYKDMIKKNVSYSRYNKKLYVMADLKKSFPNLDQKTLNKHLNKRFLFSPTIVSRFDYVLFYFVWHILFSLIFSLPSYFVVVGYVCAQIFLYCFISFIIKEEENKW